MYTYTYNNVDMCTKSNISIILHGIQMYEIVPLSFTQDMNGEMKGQPLSHMVTGRMQEHSLHQCKGVGHLCHSELISSRSLSLFGL